jgi:hypothetical protein
MKKLLLLLLLLPFFAIAQVSNGREFEVEAIKTTGSQTITNPVYLVTEGVDGTHGKTTATSLEKTSNKSTLQTGDGTGSQYLTKDATAGAFNEFAESTLSTGAISNLSKVEMIATSTTNLKIRGTYAVEGVPDNYSPMYFASNLPTDGSFIIPNFLKSFDSFNYPLSQLETPTGNNEISGVLVNTNKTYVKFLGLKFNGGIITGDTDFKGNKSVASLGYIVVVRTAGVITFKFSPSSESVVNQVLIAGNTSLARDNTTLTTDVGISFSTTTTAFNSITGNLYGMSINWHTNNNTVNPNNGNSINTKAVIGVTNQPFSAATPTSFNSTSPALLNTTFDGDVSSTEAVAIKTAYFNTTTQLTTAATGNVFLLYRLMITQGGRWFWQIESAPNNGALSTTITDAKTKALTYVWDDAILPKGVWIKMGTLVISRNYTNFNPANSNDFAWFPSGAGGGGSSAVQIIGDATETVKGVVQLATPAETTAGTDNTKAVHPLGLKGALDAKIGAGTTNTVSKFSAGQLVNSNISDTGSAIVLGVAGESNTVQSNGNLTGSSTTSTGSTISAIKTAMVGNINGASLSAGGILTATGGGAKTISSTYIAPTLLAGNNNDLLIGLDINPTFTNGAFTGVTNYGIRTSSAILLSRNLTSSTAELILSDFNGLVLRGVKSFAWADNVSTRFFQIGNTNDNIAFTLQSGGIATRTMFSSLQTQITTGSFITAKVPTGIFEITNGTTGFFNVFSTGNITVNSGTDNGVDKLQVSGTAISTAWKTTGGTTAQFVDGTGELQNKSIFQNAITGLTTNYLPKWNGSTFVNTLVFDNGTNVGFDTNNPIAKFQFDVASATGDSGSQGVRFFAKSGTQSLNIGVDNTAKSSWIQSSEAGVGSKNIAINPFGGNTLINTPTDNGVDELQVNGTISASPATLSNQVVVKSQLDAVRPYKVYTALVSQTGTNAPTATVLENTLGGTVVWSYASVGQYTATLTGAFTVNKTTVFINHAYAGSGNNTSLQGGSTNVNTANIRVKNYQGTPFDGEINGASIEIRVYN